MRAVRADARPVPPGAAGTRGLAPGPTGDGDVLARLVGTLLTKLSQSGGGTAFVVDLEGAEFCRLSRGSDGMASLARAHCCGKPKPAPDHVWLVWRTAAHRMGGAVAAGISWRRAGAH